ncbi:ATPase, AAA family [Olavius algarvensis associated proteobacterium Delta 3]|nr:ATPase, AAA family [Olavius algarvensis associated proteobacterium Delta 3]CAB5162345.1 ATPase, AAA family [Olavius algarvensis associated proteobacterium Delta 3]
MFDGTSWFDRKKPLESHSDLLSQWIVYLAGKLALHFPQNSFLASIIRKFYPEDLGSESFSHAVAEGADLLQQQLENQSNTHDRLVQVVRVFNLSLFDIDLLVLAFWPHHDERFGTLFPQKDIRIRDAIPVLFSETMDRSIIRSHVAASNLWHSGLFTADGPVTNLFDLPLSINPILVDFLDGLRPSLGKSAKWLGRDYREDESEHRSRFFPSLQRSLRELETDFLQGGHTFINLYGEHHGHILFLIDLLAEQLNHETGPIMLTCPSNGRGMRDADLVARLYRALVAVDVWADDHFACFDGDHLMQPLLIVSKSRIDGNGSIGNRISGIPVPPPKMGEQKRVFNYYFRKINLRHTVINTLSNHLYLSVSQIKTAAELYPKIQGENGNNSDSGSDHGQLRTVARALDHVSPFPETDLAMARRPDTSWDRFVANETTIDNLRDIMRRVKHRLTVQEQWGMQDSARRGDGVVALFYGTSGTGKTLAVDILATELCLPVLHVDLSKVVSKYIGDTEKNLEDLFKQAERFRALLFFDEADALFGQRTGIKDAHDRYANIETNFMLQRLEYFDGIAVLATNLLQNIDQAFLRRVQLYVHFPNPLPGEQISLWQVHLPSDKVDPHIDFSSIVGRFDLTGGEIRNASLTAAYHAAEQDEMICERHLIDAIKKEFYKKGQPIP